MLDSKRRRAGRRRRWLAGLAAATACLGLGAAPVRSVAAADTTVEFCLDAVSGEKRYGPCLYDAGERIALDGAVFTVVAHPGRKISFESADDGRRFGPYDLVENRIVRVGTKLLTLVDFRTAPRPEPVDEPGLPRAVAQEPPPVTPRAASPSQPSSSTAPARPPAPPALRKVEPAGPAPTPAARSPRRSRPRDRKSTRLNSSHYS